MNEVLRQEKKYLISLSQMYELADKISQVMREDPHNEGSGYLIRSLYFDTPDDRDFEEKEDGVELRRKLRLRCYGPETDFAMLEMKQKQGAMQKKRSLRMRREDAQRLAEGDCSVLLGYPDSFAAECFGVMQMHVYRPKSIVEYRRRAFIGKENEIRVTFDHHIVSTESSRSLFSPSLGQYSSLNPYLVVLEVKYNGFLLGYVKDLLRRCGKSETSVSKYCLARAVSKHYTF